eukprot:CAMPEP_0115828442 /NCGR_PEP_ID=MMETSP0287-20121206/575_1 /TAXON_ID=412157 /ORGANISM="Chrysochromulina rotalis, Strain UIO044" /LENGTH=98 /DNA_ID=CAMNT_0003281657 /DNA_START=331 /DNA_END=622 /DNA_ORIENTATION=+
MQVPRCVRVRGDSRLDPGAKAPPAGGGARHAKAGAGVFTLKLGQQSLIKLARPPPDAISRHAKLSIGVDRVRARQYGACGVCSERVALVELLHALELL